MELVEILNDYKEKFCGKVCCIETNFKDMQKIKINFSKVDLHHLLGLHKVTKNRASKNIELIEEGKLIIKDIKKHHNYKEVKPRISSYGFIEEVFYARTVDICIVEKDINPNTMILNLIIYKKSGYEVIVLGLKKNTKNDIYYLATLHKAYENKYSELRKTKIKSIQWL